MTILNTGELPASRRCVIGRRAIFTGVLVALCPWSSGSASSASVPPAVQAQLVSKVPSYDRAFRERSGGRVQVLVVSKPGNDQSVRDAHFMRTALAREQNIAGLPHEVTLVNFSSVAALTAETKQRRASIVYVSSGFDGELEAICTGLQPLGAMTFTGVSEYVRRCVVVGFELISGRPKLLVHLGQARKSGIRFSSELLRLAKVYQ
ncbi:MAG TPA: YfiR family protein [Polyangiaceae bacterium]